MENAVFTRAPHYAEEFTRVTGTRPDNPVEDVRAGWIAALVIEVGRLATHAVAQNTGISRACRAATGPHRPAEQQVASRIIDLLNHLRKEVDRPVSGVFDWAEFLACSPSSEVADLDRVSIATASHDASTGGWASELLRAAAIDFHGNVVTLAFAAGMSAGEIAELAHDWHHGVYSEDVLGEDPSPHRHQLLDRLKAQAVERGFRYP